MVPQIINSTSWFHNNKLNIMVPGCIHANFVKMHLTVQEITVCTRKIQLKSGSDLENGSVSPKPNQLFIMPQCFIRGNGVRTLHLILECDPQYKQWNIPSILYQTGRKNPLEHKGLNPFRINNALQSGLNCSIL